MISPEEIRRQATGWWTAVLKSHISGAPFFPRSIERIGKVRPGDVTGRFDTLQKEIELLYSQSKNRKGKGYLVVEADRHFRRTGAHALPDRILFENLDDYLECTGKRKQWNAFLGAFHQITTSIPELKEWSQANTAWLTKPDISWPDILKVCNYFLSHPRPHLYIRQLPIEIHTKFIEEHAALLQSLLDFLIPSDIRDAGQKRFAERYFLRYDEPLIRMRMLDRTKQLTGRPADISLPLSDFRESDWDADCVLIAENKMNFLTLPCLPSTISIWSGGGFQISHLQDIPFLRQKNILYWGDIDEHGFQILHQLRSYYPQCKSVMMDRETFDHFSLFAVVGARNKTETLNLLNESEAALYAHLKSLEEGNRLEQEKIPQWYVDQKLSELLTKT